MIVVVALVYLAFVLIAGAWIIDHRRRRRWRRAANATWAQENRASDMVRCRRHIESMEYELFDLEPPEEPCVDLDFSDVGCARAAARGRQAIAVVSAEDRAAQAELLGLWTPSFGIEVAKRNAQRAQAIADRIARSFGAR